jgi:dTDP-4-dehydrorhamnose reductase
MRKNLAGTYHLAGPEQFSRFDLGLTTARELGLDLSKIIGGFLSEATFLEPRGSYNSLCSEKFQREAGFEFTPLSKGLEVLRSLL